MSTLTLHVMGGLCSRLRAVLPAIGFCELTKRKLVVNWPKDEPHLPHGFECKLSDLWTGPFEEVDSGRQWPHGTLDKEGDIAFRTCHPHDFPPDKIGGEPIQYISRLRPTPWLQREVDHLQWLVLDNKPCIGVVVRGDIPQPDFSPVAWHAERIAQMLEIKPELRFFVYCDFKRDVDALREQFGDRVLAQDKSYEYDREGIMKQTAALYGFGHCDGLLGQNHSSFSETAAWMLGCKRHGDFDPAGAYWDSWNDRTCEDFLGACYQ